jgi:peroxiredoxin
MANDAEKSLQPGETAPDFELKSTPDETARLSDYAGRPLIMAFYRADFSPVCSGQMALYNEVLPLFQELGAELVGLSVDSAWCHEAFAESRSLRFPLLADFHPKGEVAMRYGVYDDEVGTADRALFVLDGDGVLHWSYVSPVDVNPGADGILAALESMRHAEARA